MLTTASVERLNKQINLEQYSSNLYMQMSAWCDHQGYTGCAAFLREHALEELQHMYKLFDYVCETGALAQLAAEVSKVSGKSVVYQDLPEAEYRAALLKAGLPEGLASRLADSDRGASQDWLFDDSHQLSALIARPTTAWRSLVAEAVKG